MNVLLITVLVCFLWLFAGPMTVSLLTVDTDRVPETFEIVLIWALWPIFLTISLGLNVGGMLGRFFNPRKREFNYKFDFDLYRPKKEEGD